MAKHVKPEEKPPMLQSTDHHDLLDVVGSINCECGKKFKSEKALAQHRRASPKHQGVPSTDSTHLGMEPLLQSPGAPQTGPTPLRRRPIRFIKASEPPNDDTAKKTIKTTQKRAPKDRSTDLGQDTPRERVNDYGKLYVDGLGDEDWSLCDKDCAWCGHCAR